MQRKFLEGLNLDKDVIDQIMQENGKDVEREKGKAELYKAQLEEATTKLTAFEGVNVDELKTQVAQLTADLTAKETEYNEKIALRDFNDKLNGYGKEFKARDIKTLLPLLNVDELRGADDQDSAIKTALADVKANNSYLFEDAPHVVSYTAGTNNATTNPNAEVNNAIRSAFGKN